MKTLKETGRYKIIKTLQNQNNPQTQQQHQQQSKQIINNKVGGRT
jgi:hypothetical protein